MNGFDGIIHAEFILDSLKKEGADKAEARVSKSIKSKMNIDTDTTRSEERRVGKECRSRWSPYH